MRSMQRKSGWCFLSIIASSLSVCLLGGNVLACPAQAHGVGDKTIKATVLKYHKYPHGRRSYLSRLIVTKIFLRIDDGNNNGNYILFDRHNRTIYSVDRGDHTVLVIPPQTIHVKPPMVLKLSERKKKADDAPTIDGHHAVHYIFYANGKRCSDEMVVPRIFDRVTKALMQFKVTLAGQQAADMNKTPVSMQSACSLADLIFAPTRMLLHGLPIIKWSPNGDSKTLVDYRRQVSVSPKLFSLPPRTYHYYSIAPKGMIHTNPPAHFP